MLLFQLLGYKLTSIFNINPRKHYFITKLNNSSNPDVSTINHLNRHLKIITIHKS